MRRFALLLPAVALAFWGLGAGGSLAQQLPDPKGAYVNDYADLLTPAEEVELAEDLADIRAKSGVHITTALVQSRHDYGDFDTIADLGLALFNHWGIGDTERNDGILLLVAMADRDIRVQLGAGYNPVWDNRAQRVIDLAISPALSAGQFTQGLRDGARGLSDYIALPFSEGRAVSGTDDMPPAPASEESGFWADVTPFLAILALFVGLNERARIRDAIRVRRRCPTCGQRQLALETVSDHEARESRRQLSCRACAYAVSEVIPYADPDQTNDHDSGGSGGGFGGGQSSGGGASGRF